MINKQTVQEFQLHWYSLFYNPFYLLRRRLHQQIKALAPQLSGTVLDFGCGSKPYRSLFTTVTTYTGLDIAVSGHSHTDERIEIYYDGKTIPCADATFDHVFSSEVFEHVFNLDEVLPEIARVLKPGGYFLLTCPFVWPEHEPPYDFARYTSFGLDHLLKTNGFQIEQHIKAGNFIETLAQLYIFYVYCYLNKLPLVLYLIAYQIFILPIVLLTSLLNLILPTVLKRTDWYCNHVVLARKTGPHL